MRILIFHGYLLGGTGSNVYNSKLCEALVGLGHEVHLLCQDRDPGRLDFVEATADWDSGSLVRHSCTERPRCTVYRPDIGSLLPVYVADRYGGMAARPFPDCTDEDLERYIAANVAAVREVATLTSPAVALANHLIMGPLVLRRALEDLDVPYAVKIHGSALEFTVKPHAGRFLPAAREGLDGARTVLVGSRHTAESLWEALEDPSLPARTRLGPPGADTTQFAPRSAEEAAAGVRALVGRLEADRNRAAEAGDAFSRDTAAAARALHRLDPAHDRMVAFVGKLMLSKGVDLLLAAWPLVLAAVPDARLVVVGFGAYREGLEELLAALAGGDLQAAGVLARRGRELEGDSPRPLRKLVAFLESLGGEELEEYRRSAARMSERVVLTGRLEHAELAELLPACEAEVVPSTFPEAFGMVAVEAAACGVLPVSAEHSGLAEVSRALAGGLAASDRLTPIQAAEASGWLSFGLGPEPVRSLAQCLVSWLLAPESVREEVRRCLVATVRANYSWPGVARGVLAAAEGHLDVLQAPS